TDERRRASDDQRETCRERNDQPTSAEKDKANRRRATRREPFNQARHEGHLEGGRRDEQDSDETSRLLGVVPEQTRQVDRQRKQKRGLGNRGPQHAESDPTQRGALPAGGRSPPGVAYRRGRLSLAGFGQQPPGDDQGDAGQHQRQACRRSENEPPNP